MSAIERATIGVVLLSGEARNEAIDKLAVTDFVDPFCRIVWATITALLSEGAAVDEFTVHSRSGCDIARLVELMDLAVSPSAIGGYIAAIKRDAARRRAVQVATTLQAQLEAGGDVAEAADKAVQGLTEGVETESRLEAASVVLRRVWGKAEAVACGDAQPAGIGTGLHEVDRILGGLCPGRFIIVAGRPAMGKTALKSCWARAVVTAGKRALDCSLEMSSDENMLRIVSMVSGVPLRRIVDGTCTELEWRALTMAAKEISEYPLHMDDSSPLRLSNLHSKIVKVKPDVVFVDYLQLMSAGNSYSREQEVGELSRGLKQLAKRHRIPIVALSQLSRGLEKRPDKTPMLSDLRESGSIEQDADQVIFVHRPGYYDAAAPQDEAQIIVAKNRHGAQGIAWARWEAETVSFKEMYETWTL